MPWYLVETGSAVYTAAGQVEGYNDVGSSRLHFESDEAAGEYQADNWETLLRFERINFQVEIEHVVNWLAENGHEVLARQVAIATDPASEGQA